ncbi:MAG TPA: ABC transporter permease, partial [Spirochaetia bacterium]|nr:ABC transporter permease [Spirochaetia bacterium]
IAMFVGLAIAIVATRPGNEKLGKILIAVTGAAQAVPSIAVIALSYIFLGIGAAPAIFALFIYSLVPITFNAASGLLSVQPALKKAARGMGMTNMQILFRIEIPVTVRPIIAGARSAATITIGAATIASAIGAGGLGDIIFIGLNLMRTDMILAGALVTALLAVAVDGLLAILERSVISPGLSTKEI